MFVNPFAEISATSSAFVSIAALLGVTRHFTEPGEGQAVLLICQLASTV
jgi:hypothetical protein